MISVAVAGPVAWYQLPVHVWAWETVGLFEMELKTHFHWKICPGTLRPSNDCFMLRALEIVGVIVIIRPISGLTYRTTYT